MNEILITFRGEQATIPIAMLSFSLNKSLSFFKEHASLIDILLNSEPLYIAAQIIKMNESFIDEHAEKLLPMYDKISGAIHASSSENIALHEALGRYVIGNAEGDVSFTYEITIDSMRLDAQDI